MHESHSCISAYRPVTKPPVMVRDFSRLRVKKERDRTFENLCFLKIESDRQKLVFFPKLSLVTRLRSYAYVVAKVC